jgi:hypothetical protein
MYAAGPRQTSKGSHPVVCFACIPQLDREMAPKFTPVPVFFLGRAGRPGRYFNSSLRSHFLSWRGGLGSEFKQRVAKYFFPVVIPMEK